MRASRCTPGSTGRRLLLPDPEVAWVPDAVRVGARVIREREIDCVLTTSPPSSAHLIGAALARRTGVRFVADMRDSWLANPHRRYERRSVRAKRAVEERIARRVLGSRGRDHGRHALHRARGGDAGPPRDPRARRAERVRLRRLRRARLHAGTALRRPARRQLLRPAQPASVPRGGRRARRSAGRRTVPRRPPTGRSRLGARPRPRRPARDRRASARTARRLRR